MKARERRIRPGTPISARSGASLRMRPSASQAAWSGRQAAAPRPPRIPAVPLEQVGTPRTVNQRRLDSLSVGIWDRLGALAEDVLPFG
jgi:hypothetical protein